MDFSPQSQIFFITGIQLDNSYENSIDFNNIVEQELYFKGKSISNVQTSEYTFIRKDSTIKVSKNIESLWGVNYLMYKNKDKWIYCFITDKRYINENNTELLIETDVMQTYQFDYSLEHSFVEREHQDRWYGVNDPIYNVVTENLTIGDEYLIENDVTLAEGEKRILIVATEKLDTGTGSLWPTAVQDVPSPFFYYMCPLKDSSGQNILDGSDLGRFLSTNPKIVSISLLPFVPFSLGTLSAISYTTDGFTINKNIYRLNINHTQGEKLIAQFNKFSNLDTPGIFGVGMQRDDMYESKLLTFPYRYFTLTDNQCNPLLLKTEYLQGNDILVNGVQSISFNPKTKYYIKTGYKNDTTGKTESLINTTVNEFPLKTDNYINYLLSQRASALTGLAISVAGGVTALGVGLATGGVGMVAGSGAIAHSGYSVAQFLAKEKDLKTTPESVRQAGNNIVFDLVDNNFKLKLYRYGIAPRIRKILGDYFHKYGYKCMEVKKPKLRSRYYFNYIKTIGANIKGNMDNKDLVKIKNIYDKGITIWHNRSGVEMLNYSYDNVEMSLI